MHSELEPTLLPSKASATMTLKICVTRLFGVFNYSGQIHPSKCYDDDLGLQGKALFQAQLP